MAVSTKFPVLSLSTVKPNGIGIEIDGVIYESMAPAAWGAEHSYGARQFLNEITTFENKLDDMKIQVTKDEVKQYKYNLRAFAKFIIPEAPSEKIDALSDNELGRLVKYFLSVLQTVRAIPSLEMNGKTQIGLMPLQDSVENTLE